MTNHGETTGPSKNGDISGQEPSGYDTQVTLRTPAELADALPYLLGYRPEDSMVLVALHDHEGRGRFGGRARLGIPASEEDWEAAARQLAQGLVAGSERRRGVRPQQMVAYVCQEPAPGESGRDVKRRLGRLAHLLRTRCGDLGVPVIEALCISDGHFWSYCCPKEGCCPEGGTPMGLPGTSVLAAAATYAGIQVRGTLGEMRARLRPWETAGTLEQEVALDTAGTTLMPRMLDEATCTDVAEETLALTERIIRRFAAAAPVSGTHRADLRDDRLLRHDEAAALIFGLQDRTTRDQAAAWMEGEEAGPALRLWRSLARRCVGPYGEHAAAPLTLAGWVAWSTGDELEAREALAMALGADPDYLFARLLHQACNDGLDPESIRRCLRAARSGHTSARSAERPDPVTRTARTGRTETPAPVSGPSVRAEHGRKAAPGARTRVRRQRRARPANGGRAVRPADARRRPASSPPWSRAAEGSRSGTRNTRAARTRAAGTGDDITGGAASGRSHREPEGED
ncbi:DUF4192 domain-containing protein [Streptomyces sp. MUM 16J]|uniref:DUF4192 domain-containing protein n=1 Tax=Streptomyces sp. MUM 16J TaxID=2791988 RepID=UPI00069EDC7E|nr:DUF4192 domain-containing protein [Streptomyces sp. MUM 16J]MCH0558764.1 DUF4192 family protein [Streptomyces sp. MUM 16J]